MTRSIQLLFLLLKISSLQAQSIGQAQFESDSLFIRHIIVLGNIRTKEQTILRELSFRAGQKIARKGLEERLKLENNLVFNTQLFTFSSIQYQQYRGDTIAIFIEVNEEWYFWPIPIIEVGDRSVNEWLRNRGGSLTRLNYGMDFRWDNFRGLKDQLKIKANFGFTNRIDISYRYPALNRQQTLGMVLEARYRESKFVQYQTGEFKERLNSLLEIKGEKVLMRNYDLMGRITYRPDFFNFHEAGIGYSYDQIADTIAVLNPDFLLDGRTALGYWVFHYGFSINRRDIWQYPLNGYFVGLSITQKGIGSWDGICQSEFRLEGQKFWKVSRFLYASTSHRAKLSLPSRQPYFEARSLGYREDYVRGYDLYVIEGQHFYLSRNTMRIKWFDRNLGLQKVIPIRQFNRIPFRVLTKAFFDMGYVKNLNALPSNGPLYNQPLYGFGLGIDFVTAYERVVRIEYSFNHIQFPQKPYGGGRFFISFDADF